MLRFKRPLLTWERTPGFLCDYHLSDFFESGLSVDPNVSLMDPKHSTQWQQDHLKALGGVEKVREPAWPHVPLHWHPKLSLNVAREEYPAWETLLEGQDPDRWSKLYYALALVECPADQDAELVFSGWDGCRLWINGAFAFEEHSYHHVILDMERVAFKLKRGVNTFLFQLDRDGVAARIEIPKAPKLLSKLRSVALNPVPEGRAISTFAQMRKYALDLQVTQPFTGKTPAQLKRWQKSFKAHYLRCLGPAPEYPKSSSAKSKLPRGAKLVETVACEGYERRRYHIPCDGSGILPCYVCVPDKSKRNGRTIIHPHGHESRFGMLAGTKFPTGPKLYLKEWFGNYAKRLAQKGFVTAVMCQRGFDERRDYFGKDDPCNVAGWRALCSGLTLPRLHIADLHVLHELLCALPEVDEQRMGISGLSGGGTLSYLAGAFDERFKGVGVFCGMCRYIEYATMGGCGLQIVPGLYPKGDVGEVLSLIAPRPLLLAQGRLDSTFNILTFKTLALDAKKAYAAAKAPEKLEVEIYELAHQYDVQLAARFFLKYL